MENYDIKIECDSFNKVWRIKDPDIKGTDLKLPVVVLMGNFDKGKSFILSQISGCDFPSGFNFSTPSICGVYPKQNNKNHFLNALIFDSAGFQAPFIIEVIK